MNVSKSLLMTRFLLILILTNAGCHANKTTAGRSSNYSEQRRRREFFSDMCYNRKPVISYIKRTKPWKEGRRDILDWGCGSGALSLALAEEGANNIVAVDMIPASVKAANERLQKFPNAIARGTTTTNSRFSSIFRPDNNKFDIVVSYMGALTNGTSNRRRRKLAENDALNHAVKTLCRDNGGLVIIVERRGRIDVGFPVLAIISLSKSSWSSNVLNWSQRQQNMFLLLFVFVLNADPTILLASQNIARSVSMRKVRVSSVAWLSYHIILFRRMLSRFERRTSIRIAQMEKAGLSEIKTTRILIATTLENLLQNNVTTKSFAWWLFKFNFKVFPGMVTIYEGVKKRAEK